MGERVESVLVGLVGRPILLLVKWLRWPLLVAGLGLNSLSVYDPAVGRTVSEGFTVLPTLVGLVLFAVGCTVRRYDDAYRDFAALVARLERSSVGRQLL